MEDIVIHEITQIEDLYKKCCPLISKSSIDASDALRWAKNSLPVEFTKWILEYKFEEYKQGYKSLRQLYREFKKEKLN